MLSFAAEYGGLQDALDGTFGERIRVIPKGKAGWRSSGGADTTRSVKEIVARYRSRPLTAPFEGNREKIRFHGVTELAGRSQTLRVSPSALVELGYDLQVGDVVSLIDRPGEPSFTITYAQPRDGGEVELHLVGGSQANGA